MTLPPPDDLSLSARRVFEDELFTLDQFDTCVVPGYLVLRLKIPASSLAELTTGTSQLLGALLARAGRAIELATGADRVYCLSFCEVDRRLHFHLFPRTPWLLEAYWAATGTRHQPINGAMLFEWARAIFVEDGRLPAGVAGADAVCAALRRNW
jgi:diadenosine tetraphosphate (Ap4A) HIT family hydrolase